MRNKDTVVFIFTDSYKPVAENVVGALEKTQKVYGLTVNERLLMKRLGNIKKGVSDTVYYIKRTFNRVLGRASEGCKSTVICEKKLGNLFYRYTPSAFVTDSSDVMHAYNKIKDRIGLKVISVYDINELGYNGNAIPDFADFYFADNIDLKNKLLKNGIISDKIYVEPIPCESEYFSERDKDPLKIKYFGNQNGFKVLIDGEGAGKAYSDLFSYAAEYVTDGSFIVYCGEDKDVFKCAKLQGLTAYDASIDRAEAFASADAIIGRGNTVSVKRISALKIPLIIYKPLNKTEKNNAKYLTVDKRAVYAERVNDIGHILETLKIEEDIGFDFTDENSVNRIADKIIDFIPETN